MTSKFTQTLSADVSQTAIGNFVPPSRVVFFDGDSVIKIGRDGTLELGSKWTDHNEAATAFFDALVDTVMPEWKEAVRAEQAAELAKWKALAETLADHLDSAVETLRDAEVCNDNCYHCNEARQALTSYKEQRDAS